MNNKETKGFFCFLLNKPSFSHMLFLENKAQTNNYTTMIFYVKTNPSAKNKLYPPRKESHPFGIKAFKEDRKVLLVKLVIHVQMHNQKEAWVPFEKTW